MAADTGSLLEAYVRLRAKAADGFESEARESVLPGITRIAQDAAGVVAAAKIWDVAKAGFEEYSAAAKVDAQTEVLLRNQGAAANITAEDIKSLGDQMLNLAGFDDEAARSAANVLLRFGAITDANTLKRVETDAADLSVAMGTDLPSAAQTLGMALQNPEQGLRRLRPVIGTLTDEQKASIKAFEDQGNAAGAQEIILKALEERIGGTAKAYGETLPGEVDKAKQSIENTKAELVGGMAPALEVGAGLVKNLSDRFQEQPEILQQVEGGIALVGGGLLSLAQPAADVVRLLNGLREAQAAKVTSDEALTASEGELSVATAASSSAFGVWGLAVAAGIVTASTAWDLFAGKVDHNLSDISGWVKQAGRELADSFLFTKFEGNPEDAGKMLDALARGGEAGVDALKRLSVELKAEGQDASAVDAAIAGATVSTQNLSDANDQASVAFGRFNGTIDEQAKALDAARTAAKNLNDQYQSIIDGTLSAFDAEIALSNAQIKTRESIEALNKARREGKLSTDEGTKATNDTFAAILNEAKANEALVEAQAKARGETLTAADAQKALVQELYGVAATLEPGSDLQQRLTDYITKLQQSDGTFQAHLNLDTADAVRALTDLQRQAAGIAIGPAGDSDIPYSGNRPGQARAMGGFVRAGEVFRGAEFGAEDIVRMNSGPGEYQAPFDGYVRTAPETAQVLAGGGGDHFEQHLHFHGDIDPAKAARRAAKEHDRVKSLRRR